MNHARITELIQQTAGALVADGDQLTHDFYAHLFGAHPELGHTFNMANQGRGFQARSLFEAIVLFVTKYDAFETLGAEARRIAAKHVSVDVRPDQYALVGASLLAVIRERLGAAATPDVMQAWELAYGRIAGVLTGVEAGMYEAQAALPGGWAGFRPFVVQRIVAEAADVQSFYLVPADGQALPAYAPGQFITLAVTLPDHPYRQLRQYSLSDAPGRPYLRLTVKREARTVHAPAPLVSPYLHEQVAVGTTLDLRAPAGEFCLDPDATRPLVLLAGGLGITPFMAMLEHLARTGSPRRVLLVHAVRDAAHQPFGRRLRQLARQHPALRCFALYQFAPVGPTNEDEGWPLDYGNGFLRPDHLDYLLTPDLDGAEFYCCGPAGFRHHVGALLAHRGEAACRFEAFVPAHELSPMSPPEGCPAKAPVPTAERLPDSAGRCPYGH